MALKLYERRLLNEPEVKLELSYGIRQPYDITLELDDSDGYYTQLMSSEELRGKSVIIKRYETEDSPAISFQAYGIISECEIIDSICRLRVSISKEDPIFQTMLPKKLYEVGDWSQTPPNIINPSRDLGKPYAMPIGNAKKVPLIYAHANYTNDYYDYLCLGPVEEILHVYRDKRLVSASEYTAYPNASAIGYPGYACVRFARMQRDPNGNLYEITADINGLLMGGASAERNFVKVLKHLLVNELSQTVNEASFTVAAAEVSNLYCDGVLSEQTSFQTIRDYILRACNGKLEKNQAGEWIISIDTYQGTVSATFGSNDGTYNNIISEGSYRKTPMDSAIKKYILKYRLDGWSNEYTMKNERTVFNFGEEIEEENPLIRDHATADRITCRVKNRALYSDTKLNLTLGMEARQLKDGDVIRVIIPRKNIDTSFQITSIHKGLAQFDVELVSYSANIYQYTQGSMPSDPQDDTLPDYEFTPPAAPSSVSIVQQGTYQSTDGKTMAYVVLQGTAPSVNFQLMLGGYRKSTETVLPYTWVEGGVHSGLVWRVRIDGLVAGQQYDYALKCRNAYGRDSAFTTITNQVAPGDTTAPAQVTGLSGYGKYKTWQFSWNKNTEADLRGYRVQIGNSNFSTIYFDGIVDSNSYAYTDDARGYGTLYCRVKAVDFSGNESALWSATASATTSRTQTGDVDDDQITTLKRQHANSVSYYFASVGPLGVGGTTIYHNLGRVPVGLFSTNNLFLVPYIINLSSSAVTIGAVNVDQNNSQSGTITVYYW